MREFTLENEIIFDYFDQLPQAERDQHLKRAIGIGILALKQDELAAFLAHANDKVSSDLVYLKKLFELRAGDFRSAAKGKIGETEVLEALNDYIQGHSWKDRLIPTGTTGETEQGKTSKNKTGDIVAEVDGLADRRIVIEVKLDSSIALGEFAERDLFTKKDTAWGQLLEATVNREARVAMIVFDQFTASDALKKAIQGIAYYPNIGLAVIVDIQRGDYANLYTAYNLARDMVLHYRQVDYDLALLELLVARVIKAAQTFQGVIGQLTTIEKATAGIRELMKKGLVEMEFARDYLKKFLEDGRLTPQDFHEYYSGKALQEKFKDVDLEEWLNPTGISLEDNSG